jgi:hypothetical protein
MAPNLTDSPYQLPHDLARVVKAERIARPRASTLSAECMGRSVSVTAK